MSWSYRLCACCVCVQVTSGHSLIDMDNTELSMECEHHRGELVRFYCDTCHVCVCVLCTYRGQPHSGDHDVLSFSDAVVVHYAPLAALLTECRQRLHDMKARHHSVVTFDQLVRKVRMLYSNSYWLVSCTSVYSLVAFNWLRSANLSLQVAQLWQRDRASSINDFRGSIWGWIIDWIWRVTFRAIVTWRNLRLRITW